MKKTSRYSHKSSKPRRWYTFLWLLLPLFALVVVIILLFYYFIFPYSSRFNKNIKTDAGKSVEKKDVREIKKLRLTLLSKSPIVSDQPSQGAQLQLTLLDDRDSPLNSDGDVIVTLSSSTVSGGFEDGSTPIIPSGAASTILRYYDTRATNVTITAYVSGLKPVSLEIVFNPAQAAGISTILINGEEKNSVRANSENSFSASVVDRFGNTILDQSIAWSLPSQSINKTIKENQLGRSVFNAIFDGSVARSETITASFGQISRNLVFVVEP